MVCDFKFEWKQGDLNAKSRCWAQGIDGWKPLEKIALFRWTLLASGSPLLNESELAATILNILIRMCQFFPSRDVDGSVIRPLPRVKKALSDGSALPHIVQLLLTFDPVLVEKVATLLTLFMADNPLLSRLFNTGIFFFVLMYTGTHTTALIDYWSIFWNILSFLRDSLKFLWIT